MKQNKKAQITTFMIIGIVILVIAIGALYIKNEYAVKPTMPEKVEVKQELQMDYSSVQSFVSSCVSKVADESVYYVSYQGGYNVPPGMSMEVGNFSVPYYINLDQANVPDINAISNEFSSFVTKNLPLCTGDFLTFKEQGYTITTGEVEVNTQINENNVVFDVKYPIEFEKDGAKTSIEDFKTTLDVNYNYVYDTVQKVYNAQQIDSNVVPIGFISALSEYEDFVFETLDFEDDTILFSLIFPQGNESEDAIVFNYLSKYDWSELEVPYTEVSMAPIPAFNMIAPTTIKHQVNATGNDLTFSDNTDLFDINPKTGLISFNTIGWDNGNYSFIIRAEDPEGNYDIQMMDVKIGVPKKAPVVEPMENLSAVVGQQFYYQVQAQDPSSTYLTFKDHTNLFDIDEFTGEISFTPTQPGYYIIKIEVMNEQDNVFEYMKLNIDRKY